ncbi:hypothetical protein [Streptomyces sp. NPDC048590]|uniref:hypothetical protein n=1 Tax=Streptomyces sp. NPDC048590 TaxID=3365574 RepID=UPI0037125854
MTDRGWDDDGEYVEACQRAARATRFGWASITGVTAAIGCALVALLVLGAVAVVAGVYVVMVVNH